MKKLNENKLMLTALIIICFVMAFVSFRQKQFRSNLKEVKELPYKGISVQTLDDGIYSGKAYTSFLTLELQSTVENKAYKSIEIVNMSGRYGKNIQGFIDELLSTGKITIPSQKIPMLEYLVFLSCLDQSVKHNGNTSVITNAAE